MPRIAVLLVALFFFCGSVSHFVFADFFVHAMPTYLPYHLELVYISGIFEMLGAIGMLLPATRILAAYGLIALTVAVFPANIHMAINAHFFSEIPPVLLYCRLPMQALIIWFIWWSVSHERTGRITARHSPMSIPQNSRLETICKEFIASFNGLLQWKWDDRFHTALAEFGIDNEEQVMAILERYFKNIWDNNTILGAPSSIQQAMTEMGGLKTGQLLFTSDAIENTFIYCVLWPWGNQKTISIRISPSYKFSSEEDKQHQIQLVKDWFGIKPMGSGWIKVNNNDAVTAN